MERRTWFITRPTRDALTSHLPLVQAMKAVADGKKWAGNQVVQKALEAELAELGVKSAGVSTSGSGGRTWGALARTFGYWRLDASGFARITPVGEALLKGDKPRAHIQKQILCYQLPNGYVLSPDFQPAYGPDYKIFPFRFMLRLLLDPELGGYLLRDEVALLLLPVQTDADAKFDAVKEEIRRYRHLQQADGRMIADRAELVAAVADSCDHRKRSDTQDVPFLSYLRDSATTHMLVLSAIADDWFERPDGLIRLLPEAVDEARAVLTFFEEQYPFDLRYQVSSELFDKHYGLDLNRRKSNFGAEGRLVATTKRKSSLLVRQALEKVRAEALAVQPETLVRLIRERTTIKRQDIIEELNALGELDAPFDAVPPAFITNYLDAATTGTRDKDFERLTAEILRQMGLAVWPLGEGGENIELKMRLEAPDGTVVGGIADCKSGKGAYRLTPPDRDLMATSYLPKFRQITWPDEPQPVQTRFFGYIVGEEFKGTSNFAKIADKAVQYEPAMGEMLCFVLNARCLLTLLEKFLQQEIRPEAVYKVLTSNQIFLVPLELERFLARTN